MTEHTTLDSFIVRIYRAGTENRRKIIGLVEALDGSDQRDAFADIDELAVILNRSCKPTVKRARQR